VIQVFQQLYGRFDCTDVITMPGSVTATRGLLLLVSVFLVAAFTVLVAQHYSTIIVQLSANTSHLQRIARQRDNVSRQLNLLQVLGCFSRFQVLVHNLRCIFVLNIFLRTCV